MERLTLRTIFIYALILVSFNNIIKGISIGAGGAYYLLNVGTLLMFLTLIVVFNKDIVDFIVLCLIGVLTVALSLEPGNTSGALYFLAAFALIRKKEFMIYVAIFTVLSLAAKYMFIDQPVTRALNDIYGYTFSYMIGYVIYRDLKNGQSR